MTILTGKHILLGVTGSIAAYKSVELASKLTQAGAQVDVILTPAAEKFIAPLTFQSVTGRKAFSEADLWGGQAHVLHVGLGHSADLLVIAPCTANTLGKLAHGIADNLLTITALAARCPLLVAPAMDVGIYTHPATQDNVRILAERGVYFAGPAEGRMASGLEGKGRFLEPSELLGHMRLVLGRSGPLARKTIVVTAGGTQEALDPARIDQQIFRKTGLRPGPGRARRGRNRCPDQRTDSTNPPVGTRLIAVTTAQQMLKPSWPSQPEQMHSLWPRQWPISARSGLQNQAKKEGWYSAGRSGGRAGCSGGCVGYGLPQAAGGYWVRR